MKAFLLILMTLCAAPVAAAQTDQMARVEFLPGWRTAQGTQMAALRISLAPGWKTYWRAPGDAGIPPSFDWSGSANLQSVQMHWPVPQVHTQSGLKVIGYHDELILPLEFALTTSNSAEVSAVVELGICKEICVPISAAFTGTLSPQGKRDPRIVAALLNQPARRGKVSCALQPQGKDLALTARIEGAGLSAVEMVAIETGNPRQWVSAPQLRSEGKAIIATTVVSGAAALDRSALRFTLIGAGQAVEIQGCTTG